ncbi:hypothetical protein G6L28_07635 [Agrobacterium larrymoorei]|uniref:hypothetical protein n=1 Tax=Agrobacterium larrymoorei TaxID=160699 RepID=UPI001574991C|nr:hypothetical protein [Agrobacterium larrymoorei]NTJ42470.1 hypothetical protein [Agrobacterium larrymoorei]
MKAILIIAGALGMTASAALADCINHTNVNASIPVDREFKTASIAPPTGPVEKPVLILKKTDRVAIATQGAVASPESALQRMQ